MFRFSIFGIPVEVQPFFWLSLAILGGAIYADSAAEIIRVVLFMAAGFISIMVHELGHALTGRKLGGGSPSILLHTFGGLAFNRGGRFTREQNFWMIAAGPGAGFIVLFVLLLGLSLIFGGQNVISYSARMLFGMNLPAESDGLISLLREQPFVHLFLRDMLWINFWWGAINLLPVLPLDGGLIADLYLRPQRRVDLLGLMAGAAMAAVGLLVFDSLYMAVLFGFLAWQNYRNMQLCRWQ